MLKPDNLSATDLEEVRLHIRSCADGGGRAIRAWGNVRAGAPASCFSAPIVLIAAAIPALLAVMGVLVVVREVQLFRGRYC